MILLNMAGVARPVRMTAKSSFATSTAFSIFSSASRRVSSITVAPSSRPLASGVARASPVPRPPWSLTGRDERADPLTPAGTGHVPLPLHAEHDHRELVVHAQAEGGGVEDLQPL